MLNISLSASLADGSRRRPIVQRTARDRSDIDDEQNRGQVKLDANVKRWQKGEIVRVSAR